MDAKLFHANWRMDRQGEANIRFSHFWNASKN
jgi:hypothetical protein